ncbi:pseudouridine synthase [Acinetobacter pittii]|uniref:pseudouridine synthase n=1 Tax=Acinetobacter TaxID=469 RepID=UPI000367FD4B|nr:MULTISPECIES: pseudouridine synthase [Acinetobacter]KQE14179.1 pseudouridylate synthase [Acinetobacter pittii]MBN6508533.1 pseudouridylate synthase [Acinetobacter pittii]MBT1525235.1 pseudouridylate synthase [Acinetobacter pittii]MCH2013489.1 pseudouridine synthase [Acinetobacter pittii]MCK0876750.1 pseudouridine synthase [Acinetobacter pittii]
MSSPNEFLPPMIDGVSASQVYLPVQTDAQTIYEYLCGHFAHIKTEEWEQRFQDGLIYAANGQKLTLDSPYQSNSHIFYYRFLAYEPHVPFEHRILFENNDLLVVDKPHFLTISPTGQYVQETLLVRLKKQTGNEFLTPIHRLDRETAGVVLFCKRVESRGIYQQLFAERQVNKIYHAIAAYRKDLNFPQTLYLHLDKGHPFYTMQVIENAKANTQTDIELIEHNQIWAKYRLTPTTGKQHQLRVHLNYLEIPIKNDPFYPVVQHKAEDDFSEPLQLLAKHISFTDPLTKEGMSFNSEFELTL